MHALALTTYDHHPDAHALRLHISLAARDTPCAELLGWSLARELRAYVAKAPFVSAACRLPVGGELALLRSLEMLDAPLVARATLLQAALALDSPVKPRQSRYHECDVRISSAGEAAGAYLMPSPPCSRVPHPHFFDVHQHQADEGGHGAAGLVAEHTLIDWLHSTGWVAYSPPPPSVGLTALTHYGR